MRAWSVRKREEEEENGPIACFPLLLLALDWLVWFGVKRGADSDRKDAFDLLCASRPVGESGARQLWRREVGVDQRSLHEFTWCWK